MNPNKRIAKDSMFARRMRSLYSACAYERKELAQGLNVTVHTVQAAVGNRRKSPGCQPASRHCKAGQNALRVVSA